MRSFWELTAVLLYVCVLLCCCSLCDKKKLKKRFCSSVFLHYYLLLSAVVVLILIVPYSMYVCAVVLCEMISPRNRQTDRTGDKKRAAAAAVCLYCCCCLCDKNSGRNGTKHTDNRPTTVPSVGFARGKMRKKRESLGVCVRNAAISEHTGLYIYIQGALARRHAIRVPPLRLRH